MLDAAHYLACVSATLMHVYDQLEQAYDNGDLEELDLDEGSGLLTIITHDNQTLIVSRHEPSRQLWLASPISGGLHFDYHGEAEAWQLPDGRLFKDILAADLEKLAKIHVCF